MVADVALDFLGACANGGRIKTLGQAPYTLLPGACQGLFLAKSFDLLNKAVLARIRAKVSNYYPRWLSSIMQHKTNLWTIGHSTRPFKELLEALRSFEIRVLVDVRTFPGSRRYPQFNREQLKVMLAEAGIEYLHFPVLGGRRDARSDSLNIAWRNKMFRGYADYMETEEFRAGIARLLDVAGARPTAIMCAEAVWWRCHRSLISDYLKAIGVRVTHIMATGKALEHPYTAAARIVNGKLSYRGIVEG